MRAGGIELVCDLRDTPTVETLWMLLPISGRAARRGGAFYVHVPAMMADVEDDARDRMEVGEIAYWLDEQAIVVFFGPNPLSADEEPRAYAPLNVLGKVRGDARALARLGDGVSFSWEALEPRGI